MPDEMTLEQLLIPHAPPVELGLGTPTPSRASYVVKTDGLYLVELIPQLYNVRLVLTPTQQLNSIVAAWCYFGRGPLAWIRAYGCALAFDAMVDEGPMCPDKLVFDRR